MLRVLPLVMRQTFVRSPPKSTRRASRETGIPNVTVWGVLRKRLRLKAYKLSIVQHLTDDVHKVVRKKFCMQMFIGYKTMRDFRTP
jgi:hypothetical protein